MPLDLVSKELAQYSDNWKILEDSTRIPLSTGIILLRWVNTLLIAGRAVTVYTPTKPADSLLVKKAV